MLDISRNQWVLFHSTGSLNCAAFTAGIVEAVLNGANFVSYILSISYVYVYCTCLCKHFILSSLLFCFVCTIKQAFNLNWLPLHSSHLSKHHKHIETNIKNSYIISFYLYFIQTIVCECIYLNIIQNNIKYEIERCQEGKRLMYIGETVRNFC